MNNNRYYCFNLYKLITCVYFLTSTVLLNMQGLNCTWYELSKVPYFVLMSVFVVLYIISEPVQ